MTWRDQMQQPSFRGVPFRATSSEGLIGRRIVLHEYPIRDEAYADDLGLKARTFTLNCFVIGDNYMDARDALEAAFEKEGPGELVHPWRGRMMVVVMECRPIESIDHLGKQGWSVTFTQTGKNPSPNIRPDTVSVVGTAADLAIAAVEEDFAETFAIKSLPEFVEADALTQINMVLDTSLSIARGMLPDMDILPAFISNASGILGKATELMRLPTNLSTELSAQIAGLLGLGQSPLAAFNALKALFGYSHTPGQRTTAARIQLDNNRQSTADLTRRTAIIEAARTSSQMEFESQNQAIDIRDAIVDAIENEQLTASDNVFSTLANLRAAVVRDISTRADDLSRIIAYTPKATLPAVVLAYSLYGDATKDADLISRNNIAHPGFVVGGREIAVLI